MFRSKEINLSESVVLAIEGIRQALEVLYGTEVCFVGPMSIKPGKIERVQTTKRGNVPICVTDQRQVQGEASFMGRLPDTLQLAKPLQLVFFANLRSTVNVWASVGVFQMSKLCKDSSDWRISGMTFQIQCLGTLGSEWISHTAQWEHGTPASSVRVIRQDAKYTNSIPEWRIGHGPANVTSESFSG